MPLGRLLKSVLRCSHRSKCLARSGAPGVLDLGPAPHPGLNSPSVISQLAELTKDSASEPHPLHLYRIDSQPSPGLPLVLECRPGHEASQLLADCSPALRGSHTVPGVAAHDSVLVLGYVSA